MSAAIKRCHALLRLYDDMLRRAERGDLEKCVRILALDCAHYRSKFGELPMSETLEVLNCETIDTTQATWIGDGFATAIRVLGMLEQEHPKH
jgi:hypothetical protein